MANKTSQVVTLWGHLLTSDAPGAFVLDVEPRMGDAERFGLTGQIRFLHRQCNEVTPAGIANGYDVIRIPAHIAQAKSDQAGNVRRKKGKG